MDIVEFLNARFDEAAEDARNAGRSRLRQDADSMYWTPELHKIGTDDGSGAVPTGIWVWDERDIGVGAIDGEAKATHIARHDPAAVLADIAGKRALLDALAENVIRHSHDDRGYAAADDARELALRHLAAKYAGRPEFKAEWRCDAD